MRDHTVIIGFGVTGAGAAQLLTRIGTDPGELVVVDKRLDVVEEAVKIGARAVVGDGTDRQVLAQATAGRPRCVIVAVRPDETAVMITMLARRLCPSATVVTAVREDEHVLLARQAGADQVIATAAAAGRALAALLR